MAKQLIIIGGGSSIQEGIDNGLWEKLKGKFTFGLNYSYNFIESTAQLYVDKDFYKKEASKLKDLPLVMGKYHDPIKKHKHPNTYMIETANKYKRNLSGGVYKASLVGIYAVSLAIHLLGEGEIYLLGYDFGVINMEEKDNRQRGITHFYQGAIEHRGIGKNNYYNSLTHRGKDFEPFEMERKVKIYNVSPQSHINNFEKISYTEFFEKLNTDIHDQDKLRQDIIKKIKELPCIK